MLKEAPLMAQLVDSNSARDVLQVVHTLHVDQFTNGILNGLVVVV